MNTPATTIILVITGLVSLVAFSRPDLMRRLMFEPQAILQLKEYERMLTSGLIHGDLFHFIFNAYSFYSFGRNIELIYGANSLVLIYVASILGGSLLSLIIHRHHDYRALGASGGVCGVIFASIFLLPGSSVRMFMVPVNIPAYVYAIGFLVVSFIGSRKQLGRVGHDAHLGGAMVGLLVATALYPRLVRAQPGMFLAVIGLSLVILLVLIFDPLHLLGQAAGKTEGGAVGGDRERRYAANRSRNEKMAELDSLLDKVAKGGLQSLSDAEREKLERLSKEVR